MKGKVGVYGVCSRGYVIGEIKKILDITVSMGQIFSYLFEKAAIFVVVDTEY